MSGFRQNVRIETISGHYTDPGVVTKVTVVAVVTVVTLVTAVI